MFILHQTLLSPSMRAARRPRTTASKRGDRRCVIGPMRPSPTIRRSTSKRGKEPMRARTLFATSLMAILWGGACHTGSGAGGGAVRELRPGATAACAIPTRLQWTSTGPLVTAVPDAGHAIVSIKDPTVVYFNDQWHVYATTADVAGHWSMAYVHFGDWSQAGSARPYYMSDNPVFAE